MLTLLATSGSTGCGSSDADGSGGGAGAAASGGSAGGSAAAAGSGGTTSNGGTSAGGSAGQAASAGASGTAGSAGTSGSGFAYQGPKIWGASDPLTDHDPAAKSFTELASELAAAGGKLNGYRSYHNQAGSPNLNNMDKSRHNAGAMLVLHMRTNVGGAKAWANIAAGMYDDVYDELFRQMLDDLNYGDGTTYPAASVFTLDSEFDRFQVGMSNVHGTTEEFKAAWIHLHDRLRKTGPHANHTNNARLLFGFAPTDWGFWHSLNGTLQVPGDRGEDRVSPMWPGDEYVDILAPDSYNKHAAWGPNDPPSVSPQWHSMEALFDTARQWVANTGKGVGKQLFIVEGDCAEWGSVSAPWDTVIGGGKGPYPAGSTPDDGSKKREWFIQGGEYIKNTPDVIGFLYWNVDYPPNTTAKAYEGWKLGAIEALE